jgi:hypothetical protein
MRYMWPLRKVRQVNNHPLKNQQSVGIGKAFSKWQSPTSTSDHVKELRRNSLSSIATRLIATTVESRISMHPAAAPSPNVLLMHVPLLVIPLFGVWTVFRHRKILHNDKDPSGMASL